MPLFLFLCLVLLLLTTTTHITGRKGVSALRREMFLCYMKIHVSRSIRSIFDMLPGTFSQPSQTCETAPYQKRAHAGWVSPRGLDWGNHEVLTICIASLGLVMALPVIWYQFNGATISHVSQSLSGTCSLLYYTQEIGRPWLGTCIRDLLIKDQSQVDFKPFL